MNSKYMVIGLITLATAGVVYLMIVSQTKNNVKSAVYDEFAQCLGDAGVNFYGAFWCPHCQEQKALFNNTKKLPYIECSTPDGQGQNEICVTENITGYPTWKLADGEVLNGLVPLETLSEKTSCALPAVPAA